MAYLFEVSAIDVPELVQQVSCALEGWSEFLFHQRHPWLWRWRNFARRKTGRESSSLTLRKTLFRMFFGILWLSGGILTVGATITGQFEVLLLFTGAVCLGVGLGGLWQYGRALLVALSLFKGVLFCLGTFRYPQEMKMLLSFAAMDVVVGIAGAAAIRIPKHSRFTHQAEQLLHRASRISGVQVAFSMEGMRYFLRSQTGFPLVGMDPLVPYRRFEAVIETEDLFLLLSYEEAVTILQKSELPPEQLENFRRFLARKVLMLRSMEGRTWVWEEGKREELGIHEG